MGSNTFRIARFTDRELVTAMIHIANELKLDHPRLLVRYSSAQENYAYLALEAADGDAALKTILAMGQAALDCVGMGSHNNNEILRVDRLADSIVDQVSIHANNARSFFGGEEPKVAIFIAVSKQFLGQLHLSKQFTGFPDDTLNQYLAAREATLAKMEGVVSQMQIAIIDTQTRLDQRYATKEAQLNDLTATERERLAAEFTSKTKELENKETEFKRKVSAFDTRESKYLRRELRVNILSKLKEFNDKFALTKGTRNLRLPIFTIAILLMAFFGFMTYLTYEQTAELFKAAVVKGVTVPDTTATGNVGILIFYGLKQIGFAAVFLTTATFLIRWSDRWFRQHADAEFMLKQLELDINRASWVAEMAFEWKEQEIGDLPPELMNRLTRNLFRNPSLSEDGNNTPDMASLLLGSAANLKIKAPSGAEIELDRKGMSALQKKLDKEGQ